MVHSDQLVKCFNKVFGYYLEISKTQLATANIPDHYIRKQTLVNAERFITPELKEFENKVIGAEEKRLNLEYQLFSEIRLRTAESSSKILKIANSPFYGTMTEISNVGRAVVTLGFDEVRSIVIGLSLTGIFSEDLGFDEFDATDLYLHSIGVATAAKMIAEEVDGLEPEDLFTAGMLHDLGRILFCIYFPTELKDILASVTETGMPLTEAEQRYGLTHSDIGAYLAIRWKLSDFLINVIRFHPMIGWTNKDIFEYRKNKIQS